MHATRNDLSLKTRKSVIALLQPLLSDTLDLQSQVRMAHWNVRGPNFIALHELFDTFSAELAGHIDSLAERIVQLGGTPEGTSRQVAKASRLKEYPTGLVDGAGHLTSLADAYAAVGAPLRAAIEKTATLGDADSSDLCTEISRANDKTLWFIEAHLK